MSSLDQSTPPRWAVSSWDSRPVVSTRRWRGPLAPARHRRGFTLVELLVVIGIIGVLIGLLLPALNGARRASRDVACLANLRSVGQAFTMYANQFRNVWPRPARPAASPQPEYWHKNFIFPLLYGKVPSTTAEVTNNAYLAGTVFECPAARAIVRTDDLIDISYGMSARLNDEEGTGDPDDDSATRNKFKYPQKVKVPSETAVVVDSDGAWSGTLTGESPAGYASQRIRLQQASARHNKKVNVLFVDGHAVPVLYDSIPKNKNKGRVVAVLDRDEVKQA